MVLAKISNVKFYRGGSKVPRRLRFNQNTTTFLPDFCKEWTEQEILNNLVELTGRRIEVSNQSKILFRR